MAIMASGRVHPLYNEIAQHCGHTPEIQYRSKVSYHLSSCFSRDETLVKTRVSRDECLVSRESLKRIFWNKLGAIMLQEND